jgi:phosphoenolpyruvate carboxykinase (ATP)
VHWNLPPAELYEFALSRGEGRLAHMGGFAASTAPHTGRSPNDKFIVRESGTETSVHWGPINQPLDGSDFELLRKELVEHLNQRELFVCDARAGEHPDHGISVRS